LHIYTRFHFKKEYTPEHESLDVVQKGIKRAQFLISNIPQRITEITSFQHFGFSGETPERIYYNPNEEITLNSYISEYLVLPETATRGEYAALLQAAWEKAHRDLDQYMQMEAMVQPVYD